MFRTHPVSVVQSALSVVGTAVAATMRRFPGECDGADPEESLEDERRRARPSARDGPAKRIRSVVDVESVRVERSADGSIRNHGTARPIRVTVTRFTVTEILDEDGGIVEADTGPGARAHLTYGFESGTAGLCRFENANGEDSNANWTGPDFRSVLPVADEAVANVPGVEAVTPAETLLGIETDTGAETDRSG